MILSICLGIIVGLISTLTGLGGGIVMVQLLPLMTGATQKEAIATSLCIVFFNCMQLAYTGYKKKRLNVRFAIPIAFMGVLTAYFSSLLVYQISNYNLRLILAVILGFVVYVLVRPPKFEFHKGKNLFRYFVGTLAGFVSGLTGLGGGIIVGPLLLASKAIQHKSLPVVTNFVTMCFAGVATITHLLLNVPTKDSWGPILWQDAIWVFIPAFITSKLLYPLQEKLTISQRRNLLILFSSLLFLKSLVSIL